MTEFNDDSSPQNIDYLLELVRPQCRECIRPRLLGDEMLRAGVVQEELDWQKARVIFVGYIALCPREEVARASDEDPCLTMIEDRRCKFTELAQMGKTEMGDLAEELVVRSQL
jgi:hypothetical protein